MKKLKGIILVVFLSIASIMMPFNVYADSLTTANINGINVTLDEVTFIDNQTYTVSGGTVTVQRNYWNYKAEIQLDDSYLGYFNITVNYYYTGRNATGNVTYNGSITKKVFVNGDKVVLSFGFVANSSYDPLIYSGTTYTLGTSDVIPYGELATLEQILQILQENQDIINDIYDEIQTVVINTNLTNNYLDTLIKLKQWHTYTESIPFMVTLFRKGYQIIDNDLDSSSFTNFMDYPIFIVPSDSIIEERTMYAISNQDEYYIVFGTNENINNVNNFNTYFDFQIVNGNFEYNTSSIIVNSGFRIIKLTIKCTSDGSFKFKAKSSNRYIMPIVSVRKDQMNFTTDFALLFKFSNRFLDNIQIIANGTLESNSAASGLESSNTTMASDMNDLANIESGYNQSFNDQMQRIDFSNPIQNNAGLLPAANFVITIFNGLISNNPLSVLIIVCCVLLIGKKVIGK